MILICGASGLVGREMCKYLDKNNLTYIGTYNKNKVNTPNMFQVDFSNSIVLEEFLIKKKINSCIFCVVERITDICENNWDEIKKVNIDLVNISSQLCSKLNIQFIHLSTDYVFDGSTQPNFPESVVNPLQNYGISKLISEYRVINNFKANDNFCIIRTPVLYSLLSKINDNAVCLIGKNVMDLREHKIFKEDNYCIRRPLYIVDLCHFIYECIKKNKKGVYHFYNPHDKFTKYEICKMISDYLSLNIKNIIPNDAKSEGFACRPYDTQLKDNKLQIQDYNFHNFKETIEMCFHKFKHPKITSEKIKDFFIFLDLDGTILDSNVAHYNSYKKVFEKRNKDFLDMSEWNTIILDDTIDNYLKTIFDESIISIIKQEKREYLKQEEIGFTKNSNKFLEFLIENDFNFCVVTNTNQDTVNIFKDKFQLLNKIKNWVVRDDYSLPKPNGECYELAKNKYYKGETYVIGFEDSSVGYNALKSCTDIIYIYNNEPFFKNNDCYLFDDYNVLYY